MSLLDLFNEYEKKYETNDLYRLKKIYDTYSPEGDYTQLRFELKTIFAFIDALQPKSMTVDIDERYKEPKELEFRPTLSKPNIFIKDWLGRDFCFWYKPIFYYPYQDSAKSLLLDFVVVKGEYSPLYNLDAEIERILYSQEFLSNSALKNLATRMLGRMRKIHIAAFVKKKFSPNDLTQIKSASFFLKPTKLLLVSEEYLPEQVKMNLPLSTYYSENVDMNSEKFKDIVKKIV